MDATDIALRPISELDIEPVTAIDEKIGGKYRPEEWERQLGYYLRRDPEMSLAAESGGNVIGFMLGEVRAGEFGLEEPTGWIAIMGVDPDFQNRSVGMRLMKGMIENFRKRGATSVRTLVNEETQAPLLKFFTAARFESTPIRTLTHPL